MSAPSEYMCCVCVLCAHGHVCSCMYTCVYVCVCIVHVLCICMWKCVHMCMNAHACIPVLCVCALRTCYVYVCGSVCVGGVAKHSHIRKEVVFLKFSLQWEKHLTAAAMQKG